MDNYTDKTKPELIAEIERLEKLNNSLKVNSGGELLSKLSDSEEKYKALYENAPLAYQSLNEDGTFKDVNPRWLEVLGYEREEIIGQKYADFLHPDWAAHFEKNFPAFKKRGYVNDVQFKIRHKDGHYIDISFEGCIGYNPDGSVRQTYCVFQDITEQKKAQEALVKNERRLKDIFTCMNEGFSIQDVICDEEGNPIDLRFIDANPAFEKQTGLKNSETLGHTLLELFPTSEKLWIERYGKVGITGEAISFEAMFGPLDIYYQVNAFQTAPRQFGVLFTDINERKLHEIELTKAKEKVEESEKYLKYGQKLAKLGHWKLNPETLEVVGSDELLNIFEIKTGKLTLDSFMKVVHPDDTARNKETIERGIREGKAWDIEHRLLLKNGKIKWIRAIGKPFFDQNNKVTQVDGIVQNITEQKNAENKRIESEAFNRGIVDNSNDCIKILDLEANLQFMSKGGKKRLEIKNIDDYIGKSWFDLFTENDRKLAIAAVNKAKAGEVGRFKSYIPSENGKPLWWEAVVTPVVDVKGKLVSLLSISRDITEQMKAEEQIYFQANLLEVVEQAVIVTNHEGIINFWNPFAEKLYGWPAEEVIGRNIAEITVPQLSQNQATDIMAQIGAGKSWAGEFLVQNRDGNVFPAFVSNTPIVNAEGELTAIIGISTDITERKVAEKALKESEGKFRGIYEQSPVAIEIYDREGKLIDVNQTTLEMFGVDDKKYILGFDLWADPNLSSEKMEMLKNGKPIFLSSDFDFEVVRKKNLYPTKRSGIMYMEMYAIPLVQENENTGFLVQIVEITERKQAEILLRDEKERIRTILDMLGDPIFVKDNDHVITLANQAFFTMFKMDEKDVIGHTLVEAVPENERHHFLKVDREVLDTGIPDQREEELTVNGSTSTIITRKIRFEDESGDKFLVGSIHDITERKQAEDKLYESLQREQLQANIVRNSPLAIAFGYPDGRLENCNKAFSDLTGYSEKELKTINWNEVLTPSKWMDIEAKELRKLSFDNNIIRYEKEYIHKSGKIIPIELVVSAKFDTDKNIIHFIGFISDITERKQFFKSLQERNEYIESIMSSMPIGFAINSIDDGAVKYMNKSFEDVYGWSHDILNNTSVFFEKVFPEQEYREKMTKQIIADMQSGDPKRMDWENLKIVTSTGEVRYVHAFNIPLFNQNLMISTVQDTTHRKLAEDELKKHRENLEELVKERTKDLKNKNEELERFNDLFVGRELRIKELRDQIKRLEKDK